MKPWELLPGNVKVLRFPGFRWSTIPSSGATGLAGGDHLHYSILVHGTFVNPVEWWDARWIRHNITDKLADVKLQLGQGTKE